MVVTRGAQTTLIFVALAAIVAVYGIAWLAPSIGLYHDDGVYLITARSMVAGHGYAVDSLPHPVAQTKYPPLFPSLLAVFSVVSMQTQWLKLLPLLCTAGWLWLTWVLLTHLGASNASAWFLVLVTAASPMVIFLGANLMSEPLFALLVTASLLVLVQGKNPLLAGILAGLATVTRVAGVPLIAAGIITYLVRRRLNHAALFAAGAMIFAAPWFGWAAAHRSTEPYYGIGNYSSLNIFSGGLSLAEKLRVVALNTLFLFHAPSGLLGGTANLLAASGTAILLFWSLVKRRQLVPDLFVLFYCLLLLTWTGPPQRFLAPVLPLVLWLIWRVAQAAWPIELIAVLVVLTAGTQIVLDSGRVPLTRRAGVFPAAGTAMDEWSEMRKLAEYIQANTPRDSILMANLDPVFYLETGRHAVRGFSPNGYDLFYAPTRRNVAAFQLLQSIRDGQVNYVAVTPDRDFAEAPGFRRAVLALERDGVVEPVPIPGLHKEYQLWKVTGLLH